MIIITIIIIIIIITRVDGTHGIITKYCALMRRYRIERLRTWCRWPVQRQRVGHTENECDCCGDESTTVYVVANGGSVPLMTMAAVVVVAEVVVVVVDVNAGGELLLLATLAAAAVDSVTVSVGECVRACTCKRARVFVWQYVCVRELVCARTRRKKIIITTTTRTVPPPPPRVYVRVTVNIRTTVCARAIHSRRRARGENLIRRRHHTHAHAAYGTHNR